MKKSFLLAALALGLTTVGASAEVITQNKPVNVVAVVRVGGSPVAINQTGYANVAGVVQAGASTSASVRQTGAVNSATVIQTSYPAVSSRRGYYRAAPVFHRYRR